MASTTIRPSASIPPHTPTAPNTNNNSMNARSTFAQAPPNTPTEKPALTPTSESRMNPPSLPRSLMNTPVRVREDSVASSAGGSTTRKPRQNLDEGDHLCMLKHCYEQRHHYKEGGKSQFWAGVNAAFQAETGKVLAQLSATVSRLMDGRRRVLNDWQRGAISDKPGGELNDAIDQWMEFMKQEDGDGEEERMRQVDTKRMLDQQKVARRQSLAAEAVGAKNQSTHQAQAQAQAQPQGVPAAVMQAPVQPQAQLYPQMLEKDVVMTGQQQSDPSMIVNGDQEANGFRPSKRRRVSEYQVPQPLQTPHQQEAYQYRDAKRLSPTRRVIVEGALSKEDWRDVMGNDARLRALEVKLDKMEVLITQNNRLLLQIATNQTKERIGNDEEDRVPVHLDAEFERDYL